MKSTADGGGVKRAWDKYKYAALVVLIGAGLMLWPTGGGTRGKEDGEIRDIQREMEEVLGKISGVGQVRVMLTVESDGERELAADTALTVRGGTESPSEYVRKSETVLVDAGSGDEVVVTRTLYPTYRGALVVCQGGDRAAVRLAVTQAVSALTGLPSGRIAVEKWQ